MMLNRKSEKQDFLNHSEFGFVEYSNFESEEKKRETQIFPFTQSSILLNIQILSVKRTSSQKVTQRNLLKEDKTTSKKAKLTLEEAKNSCMIQIILMLQ